MRMEYSETGVFEDLQTQTVLNREFPVPEYSVTQSDDRLEIETEAFHMIYDKKKFSEEGLFIDVKYDFTNYGGRWYFGAKTYSFPPREHNLKGTMRTLDRADGEVELEYGLMDKSGRTFFDDSKSFVFDEENKTYGAIQLNRDTMTEVSLIDKQGEGEATAEIQLCTAHWYGGSRQQNCENTVKAVSKLLGGIPIDGYYEMPMDTIPLLNKQAGGVKVKLLEDFTFVDPQMKKGRKMILNDTQAYHYIHDRYGVGDEENTSRMKRQRQYLGSLVKKIKKQAASDKKILARIMNELNPYVVSEISTKKLTHYSGSLSEYQYKGLLTIKGTVKTGKALGDGIEHREFYPDASSLEQTVKTLYPLVAKDELQTAR